MNFISTKDMTNDTAPSGQVLVQYLNPSWGSWSVEFGIGYFDNPNDYDEGGKGWLMWNGSYPINVIAYCILPEATRTPLENIKQVEFEKKFGSFHPNLGNAAQLTI